MPSLEDIYYHEHPPQTRSEKDDIREMTWSTLTLSSDKEEDEKEVIVVFVDVKENTHRHVPMEIWNAGLPFTNGNKIPNTADIYSASNLRNEAST